jgi:DNA sulfur modification protein DndB
MMKLPEMNMGANSNTIVLPAMKYLSGGREWLAVTISYKALGKFVSTSAAKKKNQNVIKSEIKNRFLDIAHKNDIKMYIKQEEKFTIPPITLVAYDKLPFRAFDFADSEGMTDEEMLEAKGSILGMLFLPIDYEFLCLDGNHRTKAIDELAAENPEVIAGSSMLMNIVYEQDDRKIRQDFVDVNSNAKATTASINTLFNTRDLISGLVVDVIENVPYLEETTELLATSVSKNSKDIYTINNIKNAIIEIAGYNSQGSSFTKLATSLKDDNYKSDLLEKVSVFFNRLGENEFIQKCLIERDKTPNIRNSAVITSGTGIVIAARVAGTIFARFEDKETAEIEIMRLLHELDWSRKNKLFVGKVIIDEKILNSREAISSSVQSIKFMLGYAESEQIELIEEETANVE